MKRGLLLMCCLFLAQLSPAVSAEGGSPKIHREILSNGLTLLVVENHELPVVHLRLRMPAGSSAEQAEDSGLAALTASMMMRGCAGFDADALADAFDSMGARASFRVDYDYCDGTLSLLREDLDKGLELFARTLLQPSFNEDQFAKLKDQFLALILRRAENPRELARLKFMELVWPDHPYGRPLGGVRETVEALSVADVREYHAGHYLPQGSIIALVGDITPAAARRTVNSRLNGWNGAPASNHAPLTPGPVKGRKIVILDKDQPQSNIYWGHLGVRRGDDSYYALRTLNYILGGGGFVSRLTDRIRTKSGLAYSAYSAVAPMLEGGTWIASVGTRSDATGRVVEMILEEVERIRKEPVSEAELSDALGYYLGSLPLGMETGPQLASLAVSIEFYGLGEDYFEKYPDLVTAVSPELLLSASGKYLSEDDWVLVVAGPAEELTPQLEQFGTVEVLPLTPPEKQSD